MRRGITLIELLIAVGIGAVLIALALAAVQNVRESARRVQCANNLHQIGLGFASYHDSRGRYPSGGTGWWSMPTYVGGVPAPPPDQFAGWAFQILPHVGQQNLYRSERDVTVKPVELYFCPSRRPPTVAAWGRALIDYASASTADSHYHAAGPFHGVVVPNPLRSTRGDVKDGLSNTLLVGEKRLNPDRYRTGDWCDDQGHTDGWDNDVMCMVTSEFGRDARKELWYEFGSAHREGSHFLFADGSVKYLKYGLAPEVLAGLGDRRDGLTPRAD